MTGQQDIPPYSHPKTTRRVLDLLAPEDFSGKRILDLGAGAGYLSWKLSERLEARGLDPAAIITPCDLYPEEFRFAPLRCVRSDFNGRLPFDDATFDCVVCMEVIEHIADQPHLLAEAARVLKPGGRAIVTTPNVLNINARLRYLFNGTIPLFDIVPIAEPDVVQATGHVHPVSLYYLHVFARQAGFSSAHFHIDRVKKSAVLASPLFWVIAQAGGLIANWRRRRLPYWEENAEVVRTVNSWRTFVGRTILMDAVRG